MLVSNAGDSFVGLGGTIQKKESGRKALDSLRVDGSQIANLGLAATVQQAAKPCENGRMVYPQTTIMTILFALALSG